MDALRWQVLEENVDAVNVFTAMATQWNVSANGAIGLNYGAVTPVLRLLKIKKKHWNEVFADIRILEDAALEQMRSDK